MLSITTQDILFLIFILCQNSDLKGSLVVLNSTDADLGRDIAMHITAINPMVIKSGDIPEETIRKEREIYLSQAQESG